MATKRPALLVVGAALALLTVAYFARCAQEAGRSLNPGDNSPLPNEQAVNLEIDPQSRTLAELNGAKQGESDPKVDAPKPQVCRVVSMNAQLQLITGVQVRLLAAGAAIQVQRTNADGCAYFELSTEGPVQLEASLDGYSTEHASLVPPLPGEISIVLYEEASVSGTVRTEAGPAVGEGCRVAFTRRNGAGPAPGAISSALRGEPFPGIAYTDSSGRYTIRGLRKGQTYAAFAAYPGHASDPSGLTVQTTGEVEADILVQPLYAVVLRLAEAVTGQLVQRTPNTLHSFEFSLQLHKTDLHPLMATREWIRFFVGAGVDTGQSADVVEYLIAGSGLQRTMVSVPIHTQFCGYEPLSAQVDAVRLDQPIKVQRLELKRACAGWGTLQLEFPPMPQTRAAQSDAPLARLELHASSGDTLTFPLELASNKVARFDGIPWGSYSVLIASTMGQFMYPAPDSERWRVEITAQPLTLQVPALECGAIEIEPRWMDESRYTGPLEVTVLVGPPPADGKFKGHKAIGATRRFLGPPYKLDWLAPGSHTILLRNPKALETFVSADVQANRIASVGCTLR